VEAETTDERKTEIIQARKAFMKLVMVVGLTLSIGSKQERKRAEERSWSQSVKSLAVAAGEGGRFLYHVLLVVLRSRSTLESRLRLFAMLSRLAAGAGRGWALCCVRLMTAPTENGKMMKSSEVDLQYTVRQLARQSRQGTPLVSAAQMLLPAVGAVYIIMII
jgi:hypothetical protein